MRGVELVRASRCWPSDEPEAAKKAFTVAEFEQEMKGISTTSVGALWTSVPWLQGLDGIVKYIDSTVKILQVIKPIYNFKAGE